MKKLFLLLILAFVSVFGLTACEEEQPNNNNQQEQPAVDYVKQLNDGVSFLKQYYAGYGFTNEEKVVTGNIEGLKNTSVECSVVWTVDVTSGDSEGVTVAQNEDGTYTVTVAEKPSADILFKLIAFDSAFTIFS